MQFANNYTFEVAFNEEDYTCKSLTTTIDSTVYTLQQIHFHSPSEHTVAGGHYDGEAHFVHKSATGQLVVLGVFLQASGEKFGASNNSFLNNFWNEGAKEQMLMSGLEMPVATNDEVLNPYHEFIPNDSGRYIYKGSLTTPPCSEGVTFHIFYNPVSVSEDDIAFLRNIPKWTNQYATQSQDGNSFRPTQALNGRDVTYSPAFPTAEDDDSAGNALTMSTAAITLAVVAAVSVCVLTILMFFCLRPAKSYEHVPQQQAAAGGDNKTQRDLNVAL